MNNEQYEVLEYCERCREYHLVNEELGSWVCPNRGKRPFIKQGSKPLDKALNMLNEDEHEWMAGWADEMEGKRMERKIQEGAD